MKTGVSKGIALLLCLLMLVSSIPMTAFAVEYVQDDSYYLKLVSKRDWELAPGITESEIILSKEDGSHRQVSHVVEIDIHNPYTKVMPSTYKMAEGLENKEYKVQTMSEQAKYAEEHGYGNVVAAMNTALHWYDTEYYEEHPELIGEPLGLLIMDGARYENSQYRSWGAATCLVINFDEKDGVPRPSDIPKTEIRYCWDPITGWEEQVIPANFGYAVINGVSQFEKTDTTEPAPRSLLGIKADGSIVIMMNDGRQSPYSTGFNLYEMAEMMISLGCVQAINCDGGGSSTFLSQRPGEELELHCSPSDGAERPTTHGILVISTAPAAGEFEEAHISSDYDYYTPGSSVQFRAVGSDHAGAAADIPANAIWELADDSFGIIENGLFVSNGKKGTVTVRMTVDGEVVGEKAIHIVTPDALSFASVDMAVPFGGRVDLGLNATYDSHTVALRASDVAFTLSNPSIGSISGFYLTAGRENLAALHSTLTATVGGISTTTSISLGKGSKLVYAFENEITDDTEERKLTGWSIEAVSGDPVGELHIAGRGSGKGKNGDFVFSVTCDYTQVSSMGEHTLQVTFPEIDSTGATSVGFWMYVSSEARHAKLDLAGTTVDCGSLLRQYEGWHYVTAPVSGGKISSFRISVDDTADEPDLNGKFTLYIDDITLDYSAAVNDRHVPVFSTPVVINPANRDSAAMNGQTVHFNTLTFEAPVADNTAFVNASGIAASTAQAYIDGVKVDCEYRQGKLVVSGVTLADGFHTVKFQVADRKENTAWITGTVYVEGGSSASTVHVQPRDPAADRLPIGSLYWTDVIATDIETVDTVELILDLNNSSSWELEGMTLAEGFTASYSIKADENIATVVISRTGENAEVGETVLASIPVRTWVPDGTKTPAELVRSGNVWARSIELSLDKGQITFVASYETDTLDSFGMKDVSVDTELFFTNRFEQNSAEAKAWLDACVNAGVGFHEHTLGAAVDKAPTATLPGYVGRVFCTECGSAVKWGTVLPAAGHDYKVVGNQLICACGDTFTGIGLQVADGKTYYTVNGKLKSGWVSLEDGWYYFNPSGFAGLDGNRVADNGVAFVFVNGRVTDGTWVTTSAGTRYWYGPGYYRDSSIDVHSAKPFEIDGKTYLFSRDGYMQTGIVHFMKSYSGTTSDNVYYDCGRDGVATLLTGAYQDAFYIDGIKQKAYKLVKDNEGNLYFISDGNKIAKNTTVHLSAQRVAGMTFPDGRSIPAGSYRFDAEGKMVIPEYKHGVVGDFLYINDVKQTCYKLVEFEGGYYFISDGHKIVRNTTVYLSAANVAGKTFPNGMAIPVGRYNFDADGKMILPDYALPEEPTEPETEAPTEPETEAPTEPETEAPTEPETDTPAPTVKNGVYNGYLYVNDVRQTCYKLVELNGSYYFVSDGHKVAVNTTVYLTAANVAGMTYPDGTPIPVGRHQFDAEGKMILN